MKSGRSILRNALGRRRRFFHLRREFADDLRELRRCGGGEVRGKCERGAGRSAYTLGNVREQAHIFRNRLEQLRRRRCLENLQLQALHLVGKVSAATSTSAAKRRSGATWRRRKSSFAGVMSVQKSSSHASATCSQTFFTGKESRGMRLIMARTSVIAWREASAVWSGR